LEMEVETGTSERSSFVREAFQELCVLDPKSLASGGGSSRLFNKFKDVGTVRQVGPTRILTPIRNLELPRRGGVEAWHLYTLFDCALDFGYPTVVIDYVTQVCQDAFAVSSDPTQSFLMDQALVEVWCEEVSLYLRREFISLLETVDPSDHTFLSKGAWIEKLLCNLELIFEVLLLPQKEGGSIAAPQAPQAANIALSDCARQVSDVIRSCKTCNWSCHEGLSQLPQSGRHGSVSEWKSSLDRCKKRFGNSKLFIQDLLSGVNLPIGSYPFTSFIDAVKKIYLQPKTSAGPRQQKRVYLYYLIDIGCPDSIINSYAAHFDLANAECAAIRAYSQLDSQDSACIDEACSLLPSITKQIDHARVVEFLMLLGKPQAALDIIRSTQSEHVFPAKNEALLTLDIYLSCKGLYEAFLYCQKLWKRAEDSRCIDTSKECTRRLCTWSEKHNLTNKLMEMPFTAKDEVYLHECFDELSMTSAKNTPHWPLYLVLRRRYVEASAALKDIQAKLDQQNKQMRDDSVHVYRQLSDLIDTALGSLPKVQREMSSTSQI